MNGTDLRVLGAILDFRRRNGGATPTLRDLMKYTGLRSTSAVNYCLRNLAAAGYITRPRFQQRPLVIHDDAILADHPEFSQVPRNHR